MNWEWWFLAGFVLAQVLFVIETWLRGAHKVRQAEIAASHAIRSIRIKTAKVIRQTWWEVTRAMIVVEAWRFTSSELTRYLTQLEAINAPYTVTGEPIG